jgi:hypothetical protein
MKIQMNLRKKSLSRGAMDGKNTCELEEVAG